MDVMKERVFALYITSLCCQMLCQVKELKKKNVILIAGHTKGQPDEIEEK